MPFSGLQVLPDRNSHMPMFFMASTELEIMNAIMKRIAATDTKDIATRTYFTTVSE
jgi:hypothetical protein